MFKIIFADIHKNLKLFFGTFISILVATVIVTACLNLVFSATSNFSDGNRFDNVDFVLIANQDIVHKTVKDNGDIEIDKEKVEARIPLSSSQVETLKSKYNIIEDYTFHIKLENLLSTKIAGHNFSSIELSEFNLAGTKPTENQVVIDEKLSQINNLEVGDNISIYTNNSLKEYQISGIVSSFGKEKFEIQNYVFFNDEIAKSNSQGCQSVAILDENVTLNDFHKDEFTIFTNDKTNKAELSNMVSNDITLMVIFITMGSVCLAVSLFVISGAMQFSIKNRFRLLTQLRVIGLKKSKIVSILSIQTMIISIFATSFGVAVSNPLANTIANLYGKMGIIGDDFNVSFSILWSAVVAVSMILISILVSVITSQKPLSITPATAIKSEGEVLGKTSLANIIAGVIFSLGGIAILIFAPMTQGVGIGMGFCATTVFLISAMLGAPIIIRLLNAIFSIITKRFSKSLGGVAYGNIKMKASKFAVASVSIAIMMSMGTVMMLNNETYIHSTAKTQYELSSDYKYISFDKFSYEIKNIASNMATKTTSVIFRQGQNLNSYNALAVLGDLPKIDILTQNHTFDENTILVSKSFKKLNIGDSIELFLENGAIQTFIVGGFFSTKGITDENYSFIIDYNYIKNSMYNQTLPTVYTNENTFESTEKNTLEYYKNTTSFDVQSAASLLLGFIAIVLSIVALFNTFFVIMSVRRKEFNGLKIIGAKKLQIFKMTFLEVLIVTTVGMLIGLSVLIACVGAYSYENTGIFNFVVNNTVFYGTIIFTAILGIFLGILPSMITIKSIKRQFRDDG